MDTILRVVKRNGALNFPLYRGNGKKRPWTFILSSNPILFYLIIDDLIKIYYYLHVMWKSKMLSFPPYRFSFVPLKQRLLNKLERIESPFNYLYGILRLPVNLSNTLVNFPLLLTKSITSFLQRHWKGHRCFRLLNR